MDNIVVKVNLTDTIFMNFSFFNNYKKDNKAKMIWILPIIMLICGIPMFWVNSNVLGIIIIAFGILYPLIYTGFFYLVINKQIKDLNLKEGKDVYICTFNNQGVFVEDYNDNSIEFKWNDLYRVYEVEDSFYVYAIKNKAYLIPKKDIIDNEENKLRNIIVNNMGDDFIVSRGSKRNRHA